MGAAIGRACNLDSAEDADEEAPLSPCQKLSLQVFFLGALYNNLEGKLKSISEVDKTQWDQLYGQIQKLNASLEANDWYAISRAIEGYFIPFVQDDDVLMPALKADLPAPGRTWEHFLEFKLKNMNALEREKFREKYVEPGEALQNVLERFQEVVRRFISAIGGLVLEMVEVPEGGGLHAHANEETDCKKIDVFYATDREKSEGQYIGQPCERPDRLHYGHDLVSIPKGHNAGISETPWTGEPAEPKKHVMRRSLHQFLGDEQLFVKEINASMQEKPGDFRNQALLYIHGFNVDHDKAIKNAAQLTKDLNFESGIVIVYSWPSAGSGWDYINDAAVIEESAHCLHRFITTILSDRVHFSKVHMLAHSMGNRALIKALTTYYRPLNPTLIRRLAIGIRKLCRWLLNVGEPMEVTNRETSSTFEAGSSSGVQAGAGNVADLPGFTSSTFEAGSSSGIQAGAGNVADLPGFTSSTFEAGSSSGVQAGAGNVADLPGFTSSTFEAGSSSGIQAGAGNVADLPGFTSSTFEAGSSSGVQAGAGNVADLPGFTSSTFEAGSSSGIQAGAGNVADLPGFTSSTFEAGSSSGVQAGAGNVADLPRVQAKSKLVNIISAAADETRNKFEDMLSVVPRSPAGLRAGYLPRFTIYSSVSDIALMASTVCNRQMRLGDTISLLQHTRCIFKRIFNMHERVDVVDASGLTYNMDKFLHSYYARNDDVLSDIQTLLTTLHRAEARSTLGRIHEVRYEQERRFFAFNEAWWGDQQNHLFFHNRVQCLSCIFLELLLSSCYRVCCFEYVGV